MHQTCIHAHDWDPRDERVLQDQITAYDAMRQQCPVAHSEYLHWSVFRHAEVMRILHDPDTFSNQVSARISAPNGMDPPEHTPYRQLIEPYFSPDAMARFQPTCQAIAHKLVRSLGQGPVDIMESLAHPYALEAQCAFMGWPTSLHQPLRNWMRKNHQATLSQDRTALDQVAEEFNEYMRALIHGCRRTGADTAQDTTSRLAHEKVNGQLISELALISILRNWTVGELGTMAASVGILAHYLATYPALQEQLRKEPELLPTAIDEILRIHAPLIANRRMTTRSVEVGGQPLRAGEQISLLWASANRDEAVFGDPDVFRMDRDPGLNLLYGAGIHVCPGAPLARLELKLIMQTLLDHTAQLELVPDQPPTRARYPGSGFASLILQIL